MERARPKAALNRMRLPEQLAWTPFVLPGVAVAVLLTVYPTYSVVSASFFGDTAKGNGFVGLDNFAALFRQPRMELYLWNTFLWVVITSTGALVLGVVGAFALEVRGIGLRGLLRSLLILPWIVPHVAAAIVWKWFYSSEFGMLNHVLQSLGIIKAPLNWLSDPALALGATAVLQIWGTFPFVMLMVSAGLQSIDGSVLDAARVDGAGWFSEAVHIILPALRNVMFIIILILVVWALNSLIAIWILTQGGPAGATSTMPIYIYSAFRDFNLSAASAASCLLLAVSLVFAGIYVLRVTKEA
jgi:multiple sugar transport system permease protein